MGNGAQYRRISAIILCSTSLLALPACSKPADPAETSQAEAPTPPQPPVRDIPAKAAPAPAAKAVKVVEKTNDYEFSFAYPAEAAAIPKLKAQLDKDMAEAKAELATDTREYRKDAKQNGYDFMPYDVAVDWAKVTSLPRFLSLSVNSYAFTGGAHGNSGSGALIWDRQRDAEIKPLDFFSSPATLAAAMEKRYCAALDKERRKRRGDYADEPSGIAEFDNCPNPAELTLLLGSSNGKAFDRIGIIADAYVAGSYAEGPYEITLSFDKAMLAAVKADYQPYFAVGR